jgi:microcystin-dependent protein
MPEWMRKVRKDLDILLRRVGVRSQSGWSPGDIKTVAYATAPDGWLLCDGSAVSRSTYAALFEAIGTTYGSGNGTTTFNLPSTKGKVQVGRDAGQTEFDTLGETGGAKTVSHSHPLSSAGQAQVQVAANSGTAVYLKRVSGASWTATHPTSNANGQSSSLSSSSGAGLQGETDDASVSTLQPYIVFNTLIKT